MTSGVQRCMYCEDSAASDGEHFWPKVRYPERTFCWENLLFICSKCNRHKLAQFPIDEHGAPLLIDPTAEDPGEHVILDPRLGRWVARNDSRKGTTTIQVLKLNRSELERGRQRAWVALQDSLMIYAQSRGSGRHERAERCRRVLCEAPFSALLHVMVRVLELPDPARYLHDSDSADLLRPLLPELRAWTAAVTASTPSPVPPPPGGG
jgi:uncharacterized protein (TIGR02646 family)